EPRDLAGGLARGHAEAAGGGHVIARVGFACSDHDISVNTPIMARKSDGPTGTQLKVKSVPRRPGLVVAGGRRTPAGGERGAGGTIGLRGAGHVRNMRLFPFARRVFVLRRRDVDRVMDPAVPFRRDARGLGIAVIDHPAPLETERRIDRATAGAVVAVALIVGADQFAEPPGPELRAKGLAAPPGEEFQEK